MKALDLREMSVEELEQQVSEASQELFNLRTQQTLGQLENSSRITQLRRDIARIRTVQTEQKNKVESAS